MKLIISYNYNMINFEKFELNNGLKVIVHQDKSTPLVAFNLLYDVGARDEDQNRTGFAHFFEHLLFEGTKNIERGKWFDIVSSNGGSNNWSERASPWSNTSENKTPGICFHPPSIGKVPGAPWAPKTSKKKCLSICFLYFL